MGALHDLPPKLPHVAPLRLTLKQTPLADMAGFMYKEHLPHKTDICDEIRALSSFFLGRIHNGFIPSCEISTRYPKSILTATTKPSAYLPPTSLLSNPCIYPFLSGYIQSFLYKKRKYMKIKRKNQINQR